jgi:hypothetical protein
VIRTPLGIRLSPGVIPSQTANKKGRSLWATFLYGVEYDIAQYAQ